MKLDGIRVLEMGALIAGPFCAKLLGEFGAEITGLEHWRTEIDAKRPVRARSRGPTGQADRSSRSIHARWSSAHAREEAVERRVIDAQARIERGAEGRECAFELEHGSALAPLSAGRKGPDQSTVVSRQSICLI